MVIERILQQRLIAIFRKVATPDLTSVATILAEEGIRVMEVALSEPEAVDQLRTLKAALAGLDLLIGAGTVVTPELVEAAYAAGADFLVTPHLDPEVMQRAGERGLPVVPGAFTPTEVYAAMRLGAQLVKIFPAASAGPAHIKALLGPYPRARLVPTGGVTPENAAEYLRAGAVAVGVGGALVNPGDIVGVRARARALVEVVQHA